MHENDPATIEPEPVDWSREKPSDDRLSPELLERLREAERAELRHRINRLETQKTE